MSSNEERARAMYGRYAERQGLHDMFDRLTPTQQLGWLAAAEDPPPDRDDFPADVKQARDALDRVRHEIDSARCDIDRYLDELSEHLDDLDSQLEDLEQ